MEKLTKIKNKIYSKINNFMLFKIGPVLRKIVKKQLPKEEKVLIHLGCGEFNDKRFINIDTRPGWHIDYVESIENLDKIFQPDYADLIYGCHVLEHISHAKTKEILLKLKMILKKGGILRLSVPDFEAINKIYNETKSVKNIMFPLMGGQGYKENFHFSVFDKSYLEEILKECGFSEIRVWNPETAQFHNFNDWSRKKYQVLGKEYQISLNLQALR